MLIVTYSLWFINSKILEHKFISNEKELNRKSAFCIVGSLSILFVKLYEYQDTYLLGLTFLINIWGFCFL